MSAMVALVGASVGVVVVLVPMSLRRRLLVDKAHRFAQRNDIPLPMELEPRIAKWMRLQNLGTAALIIATSVLCVGLVARRGLAVSRALGIGDRCRVAGMTIE